MAFDREAGATTHREPPTASALLNYVCTPDQCRTMFPKQLNAVTRRRGRTLRAMIDEALGTRRGIERDEKMAGMHEYALATPGGCKGLRVDSLLSFPTEEYWVDVGATHSTQNSLTVPVTKWVRDHAKANAEAGCLLRANVMLMEPSPAVRMACNVKHNRYKPLVDVAASQVKQGLRTIMPTFVAAIVSHTGEMAPELITLIENITRQYGTLISREDLEDGISKNKRTGIFRARFKDAIMVAMAEGFGRTLAVAGREHTHHIAKRKAMEGYSAYLPNSDYTS
jgi:hypothetical protein